MGFTSLRVAVNCSIKQFKHATFVDEILADLMKLVYLLHHLEIEITESTIMQDPENTITRFICA